MSTPSIPRVELDKTVDFIRKWTRPSTKFKLLTEEAREYEKKSVRTWPKIGSISFDFRLGFFVF